MWIVPKQITKNLLPDLVDSLTDTVKESATKMVSVEYKESFSELSNPTALDKMLLPAAVDKRCFHQQSIKCCFQLHLR